MSIQDGISQTIYTLPNKEVSVVYAEQHIITVDSTGLVTVYECEIAEKIADFKPGIKFTKQPKVVEKQDAGC